MAYILIHKCFIHQYNNLISYIFKCGSFPLPTSKIDDKMPNEATEKLVMDKHYNAMLLYVCLYV